MVGFDSFTAFQRTGVSDPTEITITPVGSPRGLAVFIVGNGTTTDEVSSVSIGAGSAQAVALSRITRATDAVTELGSADVWFLGTGLPLGGASPNNLGIKWTSATATDFDITAIWFGAGADTEVVDSKVTFDNRADPNVTLAYGGRTCLAAGAHFGGAATVGSFTPNANCTSMDSMDFGAACGWSYRQTTPGSTDFNIGGTAASDDLAMVAIAVAEVAAAGGAVPSPYYATYYYPRVVAQC